jgi:signal-transduction protein with cAMP-binding, CBS, and nucleotidyltransferase domain
MRLIFVFPQAPVRAFAQMVAPLLNSPVRRRKADAATNIARSGDCPGLFSEGVSRYGDRMQDVSSLARLDSFPYRHRLAEVMAHPVLTGPQDITLAEACERMNNAKVSSLVVVDEVGRTKGIVTERDVLRNLAQVGAGALDKRLSEVMSSPVNSVAGDAFLFVGIARMTRLGLRHLVVVDDRDRPVGMITGRALLKIRTSKALVIGDDIAEAESAADMDRARQALPDLATNLLADGVSANDCTAVISTVLRDITKRAAQLAERSMIADGWGGPPSRFALLILGSGGRGESLLTFDQDNAIVHTGPPSHDIWYAEFGQRLNRTLHEAGIPYCEGDVMACNPIWRRSLDDWKTEILHWVFEPKMQTVMNVDIFFDFLPVYGDRDLAHELKRYAIKTAATSAFFLQFLNLNVAQMEVPLGIFGEFTTTHGRLNAKKFGLLPLVSAARAKAVKAQILASNTADRYKALNEAGQLHKDDLASLLESHETILRIMLEQQLRDIASGQKPSARIEPRGLPRTSQKKLKAAFKRIRTLKMLIGSLQAG